MGIENRDYLRDEGGSAFGRSIGGGLQTVKWIIIVNVAVFVLQVVTARSGLITDALALSPGSVLEQFQIWRLVTYAFCHDPHGVLHIFFNMYILWIVGRRLESRYGSGEFLLFYLTAVVVSGLAYLLLELILARPGVAIGASGAVAAAFILYAILYPHEKWLLFFVFPIEVRWLCLAFLVFDIHPVLLELGGEQVGSGVAHAAHLGGYLFGFLYYQQRWNLEQTFSGLRHLKLPKRRPSSHLKVYQPQRDSAEIEIRTDEILQKISEQGEASLTDEERAILADASRRLRNRTRS
jgi:membrane associated rhomboid family serine protease